MSSEIPVVQYKKDPESSLRNAWWTLDKNEAHAHIFAKVKRIRDNQRSRRIDWVRFARLYTNAEFDQFMNGVLNGNFGRKLSFNVCRSCVDTACAKISKAKPRSLFLTEKGNWSQQKRAENLTQYTDGMFFSTGMYQIGRAAFRDGTIFGTGAIKYYKEDGEVKAERVFIDEIVVDELDGRNMAPRELHQTKLIPREVLLANYPKFKDAIGLASVPWENTKNGKSTADVVGIVESWHLPSGKNAKDGRHVISLESATLFDEPYEKSYFPFTFIRWNNPILGFYGEGLVSQLVGIQLEINTVLMRIKEGLELVAVPRVLVEETSNVASSHITDEVGGVLKYRGTKPDFITPRGFERETYDYLEYLYRKAFEDTGISQLSAMSKKPAGLDSRVALREFQDIETERFALVAEEYQQLYLRASEIMIDLQRDIAKEDPKAAVKVKSNDFMKTIKWKEADLDDDKFIMQPYPTSFLPKTPEGQLEFTQELIQSGYVEPEEALSLLNFPDLKGFFNLKTAAIDDIKMLIEEMVENQTYAPPEPYMNLGLALKMTQSAYLRGKTNGTSEESLELLRRFIDECNSMMEQAMPETAPVPIATPPVGVLGGVAVPPPPPVSDLIPMPGVQNNVQ